MRAMAAIAVVTTATGRRRPSPSRVWPLHFRFPTLILPSGPNKLTLPTGSTARMSGLRDELYGGRGTQSRTKRSHWAVTGGSAAASTSGWGATRSTRECKGSAVLLRTAEPARYYSPRAHKVRFMAQRDPSRRPVVDHGRTARSGGPPGSCRDRDRERAAPPHAHRRAHR
jgi:hypothetical protein